MRLGSTYQRARVLGVGEEPDHLVGALNTPRHVDGPIQHIADEDGQNGDARERARHVGRHGFVVSRMVTMGSLGVAVGRKESGVGGCHSVTTDAMRG